LIISTINENGDLIRRIARSTNNNNNGTNYSSQQQQQREQNENDVNDAYDTEKNTNDEEKIIEKVSVSQAIRRNSGKVKVTGTITGISRLSKMISKVSLYCDKCSDYTERNFNPIPVANLMRTSERCEICERLIRSNNIKPIDHKNTITIELQDTNSFDELDILPAFLFDEDTIGIKVGENVEIIGDIKILDNKFKYLPYLYGESIQYLNRENSISTKSDIDRIRVQ
jgi:hypothetical protein